MLRWISQHKTTAIILGIGVLMVGGVLIVYVKPTDDATRNAVVQTFALIVAGVVAAIGGVISWRNLQQQRNLTEERAQEDALQAYFEQMGGLFTEHDLVNTADPQADPQAAVVRQLAKAQTLTVLARLDGRRKGALVRFLWEAGLIQPLPKKKRPPKGPLSKESEPIVRLRGADLHGADLRGAKLYRANFRGADLSGADLSEATLIDACLVANLSGADFSEANLNGVLLYDENDRVMAEGVTVAQLAKAQSLHGATMTDNKTLWSEENRNRPTFEDWRKSKGSGEARENVVPS